MDKYIDREHIKEFYNKIDNVWSNDVWHNYSRYTIAKFINKHSDSLTKIILNAGSAGNTYGIQCDEMYHVDIADEKIKNIENAVCASIDNMPFDDGFFDSIICVGSVINYCDALSSLREFCRVLRFGGDLILEYESSFGFEYIHSQNYKQDACIIETQYIESEHKQWLYSPKYINNILINEGFEIIDQTVFHILDGLLYRLVTEEKAVFLAQKTDKFTEYIPYLNKHSNNVIIYCRKL